LVFDGQSRTITTNRVSCTNQADGGLLILVDGGRTQSVRIVVQWHAFNIETTCPSYLDAGPTPLPGSYMS
jgi:hypothetical protein